LTKAITIGTDASMAGSTKIKKIIPTKIEVNIANTAIMYPAANMGYFWSTNPYALIATPKKNGNIADKIDWNEKTMIA
jgi:hypothetical protein